MAGNGNVSGNGKQVHMILKIEAYLIQAVKTCVNNTKVVLLAGPGVCRVNL